MLGVDLMAGDLPSVVVESAEPCGQAWGWWPAHEVLGWQQPPDSNGKVGLWTATSRLTVGTVVKSGRGEVYTVEGPDGKAGFTSQDLVVPLTQ